MKRDTSRAIIFSEDEESIYLLYREKRKNNKIIKYFAIPGGKIEKGETIEQAVIREIKEEFQADIKLLGYLGENKTKQGIDYHFQAQIIKGVPKLGGEEKTKNNPNNYYEIRKVLLKDLTKEHINILPINLSYIEKALKKEYK